MQTPQAKGIDLDFRPKSYFWPTNLETHLLSSVKGAERKAALKRLLDGGRPEEIPDLLARSSLTNAERSALGRLHPSSMGGEYLPDMAQRETMIARITIASTTQDVTCVYARRGRGRIHYRVVDEYEGDSLAGRRTRTSVKPLTLGELETFFNGAWPLLDLLESNFGHDGYVVEQMQDFVVAIDSEFYPELARLYRERINTWAAHRAAEWSGVNHVGA